MTVVSIDYRKSSLPTACPSRLYASCHSAITLAMKSSLGTLNCNINYRENQYNYKNNLYYNHNMNAYLYNNNIMSFLMCVCTELETLLLYYNQITTCMSPELYKAQPIPSSNNILYIMCIYNAMVYVTRKDLLQ